MATIKEIAAAADLSPAAVSRILSNDESLSVSPATRMKVLKVASELGYSPKSTRLVPLRIGIFQWCDRISEMEDPYYQSIRMGVEDYCRTHRCTLVRAYQSDSDYETTLKNVNGLICIGKFNEARMALLSRLASQVVFVDMQTSRIRYTTVSLDFYGAIYDLLDYLKGLGHQRIAFFGGLETLSDGTIYSDERKRTYLEYCKDKEIAPILYEGGYTVEDGYAMALQLLADFSESAGGESPINTGIGSVQETDDPVSSGDLPEEEAVSGFASGTSRRFRASIPTAVCAASDAIALGAMRAFYEKGLRIPEDISITGFDDLPLAAFSQPPLTTVKAPSREMGSLAALVICDRCRSLAGPFCTPTRLVIPCGLTIRNSVQSPAKTLNKA